MPAGPAVIAATMKRPVHSRCIGRNRCGHCRALPKAVVGFQLHEVRGLLGHANVIQTDTYSSPKIAGLREWMKRFDAARGKPVAKPGGGRATASWPR
jgi:hypothetical protein